MPLQMLFPIDGQGGEAIILAGGLGTRLRAAVAGLPKCLAPVAGKPFLHYVVSYLQQQGIEKYIFSLGYKHEMVAAFIKKELPGIHHQLSIEKEPLGTGGAIKHACTKATGKKVFILNGDTFFKINFSELSSFHEAHEADCTLSLKPMKNFSRYGVVQLNTDASIKDFREKNFYETGLINGGIYTCTVSTFLNEPLPEKFSFEKDYLEKFHAQRRIYGMVQDAYFIDIGIPEDYQRAQEEMKNE